MSQNPYAAPGTDVLTPSKTTGVYVDGDLLVCPANTELPKICVKTGKEVSVSKSTGKKFKKDIYWCPPWVLISFLIAGLLTLILYFCFRKKLHIEYYMSYEAADKYSTKKKIIGLLCAACVIALFIIPFEIGIIFLFALLILLILLAFSANHLSVRDFKDNRFHIKGCHQDFLNYIREQE